MHSTAAATCALLTRGFKLRTFSHSVSFGIVCNNAEINFAVAYEQEDMHVLSASYYRKAAVNAARICWWMERVQLWFIGTAALRFEPVA